MDSRFEVLAKNLVNYSCRVQKGEKVLIGCNGTSAFPLVKAIICGRTWAALSSGAVCC